MTQILTWNIQWGLGTDGRLDLGRIAATIAAMGEPDVLCLQEIGRHMPGAGGEAIDQARELAALFPDMEWVFGAAVERSGGRGQPRQRFGNMILTRLPVLQAFRHPLPQPPDAAVKHMPRQATEAVLKAPFGPLRVVTTHLEYHSETQRLAQVERLRALHAEIAANVRAPGVQPPDGPYAAPPRPVASVVCGDFNMVPDDAVYGATSAPFADGTPPLIDAWRHAHGDRPHAATCGIFDKEQWPQGPHCRDFLFVTPGIAARITAIDVDQKTNASDHQPVLLRLAD
ncbi:endonuclease/exonuclease/phosphatase family protein [Shumkonia mesophila]|uniref:endonuclease/exonuclease/phosphatase family protein n=1 Tax=Shumkonia mesophila TaxID=2838854 RepID=UPI00293516C1|nr:endonuclease/exonuclease/phosphatase family protein [Shumkonia mesophila]